jgi:hypothetical protein
MTATTDELGKVTTPEALPRPTSKENSSASRKVAILLNS